MRKIAIANRKGGVGKTTSAVHIAAGLTLAGHRTLLIDTDTQGHCGRILGIRPEQGLADHLEGAADAIAEARPGLDLLAGTRKLVGFAKIHPDRSYRRELILAEALEQLSGYEYVIIDTAPGFSELSVNVLFYVEEVVVPVSMEVLAVEGLVSIQEELEGIARYSPVKIRAILPTFVDGRVGKTDVILEGLRKAYTNVTFPVHYSTRLSELPAHGQTIYEYEPEGRASQEYAKVTGAVS